MGTLWLPQGQKPMSGQRVDYQQWCGARPSFSTWMNAGAGAIVADDSGNGNHGTLTNMDPATDWVGTPYGAGLDFDGSDDYVLVPRTAALAPSTKLTVVARVLNRATTSGDRTCFGQYDNSTNQRCFNAFLRTGASPIRQLWCYYSFNGSTGQFPSTGIALPDADTWQTLGWTIDVGTGTFQGYLDGSYLGSRVLNTGTFHQSTADFAIGARNIVGTPLDYWNGQIAWCHYWPNLVLSASQVQALQGPVPVYARTFYSIPAGAGTQYLTPGSVIHIPAVGVPSLAAGAVTLTPSSVVRTPILGVPIIGLGAVTLAPASILRTPILGVPTLVPGPITLAPESVTRTPAIGLPTLTPGPVTVAPASVVNVPGIGVPSVSEEGVSLLYPGSVVLTPLVGVPVIGKGDVVLLPASVVNVPTVGVPSVLHAIYGPFVAASVVNASGYEPGSVANIGGYGPQSVVNANGYQAGEVL